MKTLFSRASISGSCFKPENVLAVEEHLAKCIYDKKQPVEKLYNKYGESTLKTRFHFDLTRFAKLLGFNRTPKKVIIENKRYFDFHQRTGSPDFWGGYI